MNPQNLQETTLPRLLPYQTPPSITQTSQTPKKIDTQTPNISKILPETLSAEKKVGKWTAEEDELLRKYVSQYSEKQWKKVSEHIPGRAPIQCLHRWTKILKPGLVKGPWTQEEDQKLIAWVQKEGPGKWAQAANLIPGRSGKQCRERWFNNLNPEVRKGNWTKAEDELIFQLYQKYGSSWSKIARYVPGRTENSIKNRFYSTLRKVATAKHRSAVHPLSQQKQTKLEEVLHDNPINLQGNALYNLLHETTHMESSLKPESKDKEKENKEDVDVKMEEEHGEAANKKKGQNKEQDYRRILGESNKMEQEPPRSSSQNITRKGCEPIPRIPKTVIPSPKIEDDSEFERFLLSMDQSSRTQSNEYTMKDVEHMSENKGYDELDDLQLKIFDFCNQNIHGLVSALKSNEPSSSHTLLHHHNRSAKGFNLGNIGQLQTYNLTPTSHSSPLHSLGVPTPTNEEGGLSRILSQQQQQQRNVGITRPFRPVAIKIPPLETRESGEVTIPRLLPFMERDLSSSIPLLPRKSFHQEGSESNPRPPLERRDIVLNEGKAASGESNKVDENLSSLIQSMNQTIGAASLVYSSYLTQVNEAVKDIDQKGPEGTREKVEGLLQQISSLGNWLKSAKSELGRLETSVKEENGNKGTENKKKEAETKPTNGNKRRYDENVLEPEPIKGEQSIKKQKTV